MIIVMVIARPYAAPIWDDSLNINTTTTQPIKRSRLIPGINNWPRSTVGNCIFILGHRFSFIASLISVKEPDINAWLAMIAATVAITIPTSVNHSGIRLKNGFEWDASHGVVPRWLSSHAP